MSITNLQCNEERIRHTTGTGAAVPIEVEVVKRRLKHRVLTVGLLDGPTLKLDLYRAESKLERNITWNDEYPLKSIMKSSVKEKKKPNTESNRIKWLQISN